MKYSTSEFKNGLKVILNNEPYTIVENTFEKPGKGQAFTKIKVKNLLNGKVLEKTYKSGQSIEAADVHEQTMTYLYQEGDMYCFMDESSYEQIEVNSEIIGDNKLWLLEQNTCQVLFWNQQAVSITPENFISASIIECEPNVKGDTVSGGAKNATISTGAVIRVPLFIKLGETIKVDTRTGEYVSRA